MHFSLDTFSRLIHTTYRGETHPIFATVTNERYKDEVEFSGKTEAVVLKKIAQWMLDK